MNEADLRDKRLSQGLKAAMSADRAPDDLVRQALAVPDRMAARQAIPAREPMLQLLLPQIAGVLLLVGMGVGFALQPDLMSGVFRSLGDMAPGLGLGGTQSLSPWVWIAGMAPVLFMLIGIEAGRGFRDLRPNRS